MKQLPANSMPRTSTEDMVAWPGTETAAVVLSLNQTQLCPSLAIGAVQKTRPQYATLRLLLYCNNRGRMQISRSHQIKPNLLWMHNFDPNRKCDSTWLCVACEMHIFILCLWLMTDYFALQTRAYLTLKKKVLIESQSHAVHKEKQSPPCS